MIKLTDQNFEEEITKASLPVLVDFWASWCGPCLAIAPILEKIAEESSDKFILAKANVDDVPVSAGRMQVDSIPRIVLFKNGKAASGFVGAIPESEIRKWLDENL